MKCINLFHSYNIVENNIFIKNNKVYDKNNKLLFKLMNVPNQSNLYNIHIEKILTKKCLSKKKCNYFYTKHNIKIFVSINYNELKRYIKMNIILPESKIIKNLIYDNLNKVNTDTLIKNVICINKNNKQTLYLNKCTNICSNFNFVKFNDIYFDMTVNEFCLKPNTNSININGGIIIYDLVNPLFKELRLQISDKDLIIVDDNTFFFIKSDLINFNYIDISNSTLKNIKNVKYRNVIVILSKSNSKIKIILDNLKYSKLWVTINNFDTLSCNHLLEYYKFFNINFDNVFKYDKLYINLIRSIYFRNYSKTIIKHISTDILKKQYYIKNNIRQSVCSICYENKINVKTFCNHHICNTCLKCSKFICPFCRTNVKQNYKFLIQKSDNILDSKNSISLEKNYVNIFKNFSKNKILFIDNIKDYSYVMHIIDILNLSKTNVINLNYSLSKIESIIKELDIKNIDCVFIFNKTIKHYLVTNIQNLFNKLSIKKISITFYLQKL